MQSYYLLRLHSRDDDVHHDDHDHDDDHDDNDEDEDYSSQFETHAKGWIYAKPLHSQLSLSW